METCNLHIYTVTMGLFKVERDREVGEVGGRGRGRRHGLGWGGGWRVKAEKGTGVAGERVGKERGRERCSFSFPLFRNVFLALHCNKCNIFSVYPYQTAHI